MLSISPEARELIRGKGLQVRLDLARVVQGCCGVPPLEEKPAVRFGPPPPALRDRYEVRDIDGITVHVPRALPAEQHLTLGVTSFLGIRRIVLEGWNPLGWDVT